MGTATGGSFEGAGGEATVRAEDDGGQLVHECRRGCGKRSALGGAASGAADFGWGALSGTGELVGGFWDTGTGAVGFAYRSTGAYFFDREAFDRQWRDPGGFASYVWNNPVDILRRTGQDPLE